MRLASSAATTSAGVIDVSDRWVGDGSGVGEGVTVGFGVGVMIG
jgi:hypothetical protein